MRKPAPMAGGGLGWDAACYSTHQVPHDLEPPQSRSVISCKEVLHCPGAIEPVCGALCPA